MDIEETRKKKIRRIRTFEADSDVHDMLAAAQRDGLAVGEIVNHALRDHGREIIHQTLLEKGERARKWREYPAAVAAPGQLNEPSLSSKPQAADDDKKTLAILKQPLPPVSYHSKKRKK